LRLSLGRCAAAQRVAGGWGKHGMLRFEAPFLVFCFPVLPPSPDCLSWVKKVWKCHYQNGRNRKTIYIFIHMGDYFVSVLRADGANVFFTNI
jgi:hypothetical protein